MKVLPPKSIRRYFKKTYVLDPIQYPNRLIEEDLSRNFVDGIYIDFKNTTANLNNSRDQH